MSESGSHNAATVGMLLDEARRMLVRQEAVLATLRTQAVALLSVSSLVAGLFGSRVLPHHHSPGVVVATWAALALFGAAALLAIVILLPRKWRFAHKLQKPLARIEKREVIAPINLAFTWTEEFEKMRVSNQATLDWLMQCFWWACICAGLQVIAWTIAAV